MQTHELILIQQRLLQYILLEFNFKSYSGVNNFILFLQNIIYIYNLAILTKDTDPLGNMEKRRMVETQKTDVGLH